MAERVTKRKQEKIKWSNFYDNPVNELKRIRPDTEPSFAALDLLKSKKAITAFMSSYEDYIANNAPSEHLEIFGSAKIIAQKNIGHYLGWRQDGDPKLSLWANIITENN